MLDGRDHEVHSAKNGDEFQGLIDKYDFDVILADYDVTDAHLRKSFYDWLIERRPAFSQRVIRMYTPGARTDVVGERVSAGVSLKKPLDKEQLLDAINSLLSTRIQPATVVR
jgi:DNA-binding NtrC family response regulator